jgi:hypothetical protein
MTINPINEDFLLFDDGKSLDRTSQNKKKIIFTEILKYDKIFISRK